MAKFLQLQADGTPKMIEAAGGAISYYDAMVLVTTEIGVSGTNYNAAHTTFTLPNSKTYDGTKNQLQVFCNEASWVEGEHYLYDESETATTIVTAVPIPKDSYIRFYMVY